MMIRNRISSSSSPHPPQGHTSSIMTHHLLHTSSGDAIGSAKTHHHAKTGLVGLGTDDHQLAASSMALLANDDEALPLSTASQRGDRGVDDGSGSDIVSGRTRPGPYDRAIAVACAVAAHCAIGGIYTFSLFTDAISRNYGVVGKTSLDWSVSKVIPVFSLTIFVAGLTAATTGSWAERVGPRIPIMLAGVLWGGGLMLSAVALGLHSLVLLYITYGVLGGLGIGFAYAPPVAGLMKWFPDRKGFASGIVVMGFGGGALLASPVIRALMNTFFRARNSLGPCDGLNIVTDKSGAKFAIVGEDRVHVVVPPSDLSSLGYDSAIVEKLRNQCFEAGTGTTGAPGTLFVLGVIYCIVLLCAGWFFRPAPPQHHPGGGESSKSSPTSTTAPPPLLPPGKYVLAERAIRSRQFYQVWLNLFLNATAGVALLGASKTLMSDVFAVAQPDIVTPAFSAGYVAVLSLFNGLGRIFWASFSDYCGRKRTFILFFLLGMQVYATVPALAAHSDASSALVGFILQTILAVTIYGGGFAISPAYLADLFGTKQVGIIYSRLLTAWAAAGLCGPTILALLRGQSEVAAIAELADKVRDAVSFEARFGKDPSRVKELVSANTLDVASLLDYLAKEGDGSVIDPRPYLYNSTMVVMALMLVIGLMNTLTIQPVSSDMLTSDNVVVLAGDEERLRGDDTEEGEEMMIMNRQ